MIANSRYWWFLATTILTLSAAWTWLSRVPDVSGLERIPSPREGFPAPDFTLTTLRGEPDTLSAHRGKVVVVNLWASWCAPCRAEMPAIQKLYAANRERGLVVLAVNSTIQDSEASARSFVEEMGLTFPVLLDVDGAVSRRYLLRALPSTFIIDRAGIIQTIIIGGPVSEALLQSKVEELLRQSP